MALNRREALRKFDKTGSLDVRVQMKNGSVDYDAERALAFAERNEESMIKAAVAVAAVLCANPK
jgi:hypothetical protein